MSTLRPLNDDERRLVDEIVVSELIGGNEPSIKLHRFRDRDKCPLDDGPSMVAYMNARLAAHGSPLRVEEIKSYTVVNVNLGDCCYLALISEDGTRSPFDFGAYDPGISWNEFRTGADLEKHRLWYEASELKRKLETDTASALRSLVERVGVLIERRLAASSPTPMQSQVLTGILPYNKSLGSWVQVCLLMGWDYEEILREALAAE